MKNLSEAGLFSAALKAGFNLNTANDIKFKISDEIELYISNEDNLSSFHIKAQRIGHSIMTSARVYNLCSSENDYVPSYSMNNYEDICFFSNIATSFEDVSIKISEMDYANRMTLALLSNFKDLESNLVEACDKRTLEISAAEKEMSEKHEEKRLKRIADYDLTMEKIGDKKATIIINEMEAETFEKEEGVSRVFTFITRSGHLTGIRLSTKWEKQRLSWYSAKNLLMQNEEVLEMLAKARIDKV
jgi:hypothetical protein